MTIYFDYNLLERLLDQQSGTVGHSKDPRWRDDHHALAKIYERFELGNLALITCKYDGLEEFRAYMPDKIKNYDDLRRILPERMKPKFQLFESLKHGDLLISPFGDYGFGCGPFGGGRKEHYELLDQIRAALDRVSPVSSQADRDARHLMHSVLYGCDYFTTMDYKLADSLSPFPPALLRYLNEKGFTLKVFTPSQLLAELA